MGEQWTEWRDHDGKGVPAELKAGMFFEVYEEFMAFYKRYCKLMATEKILNSGCWVAKDPNGSFAQILRYRIRKPDALQQMIERAEALPAQKQLEVTP